MQSASSTGTGTATATGSSPGRDAARPSLADLRLAIARKTGAPLGAPATAPELPALTTGVPAADTLLGGGLPRGRLSEVFGARSSGKTSLLLAAAAHATSAGQLVAWIDGKNQLWPPAAAAAGLDLARLLVVRPGDSPQDLARAGEIIARSRAFALVVVDLPAGVFTDRLAQRLRAAAHDAGCALVVLSARRGALPHAHCQLELHADPQPTVAHERRFALTLHRGGPAPGERTTFTLGEPARARYRDDHAQLELAAVAAAITPVRVDRSPTANRAPDLASPGWGGTRRSERSERPASTIERWP